MENSNSTGAEACIEFEEGDRTEIPVPHQATGAKNTKNDLLFSDLPVISFSHTLCHFFTPLCSGHDIPHTWNILSLSSPSFQVQLSCHLLQEAFPDQPHPIPSFTLLPKYLLVSACSWTTLHCHHLSSQLALGLPEDKAHVLIILYPWLPSPEPGAWQGTKNWWWNSHVACILG